MNLMRTPKVKFSYAGKMFMVFLVIFVLVQIGMYVLSKSFLPFQMFVDARGWIYKTTLLIFIETMVMSVAASALCMYFIHQILGPVPRLVRELKAMDRAGVYRAITVRTDDKLRGLVEVFNALLVKYMEKKL